MGGRTSWYGSHPPACTCWRCNLARRDRLAREEQSDIERRERLARGTETVRRSPPRRRRWRKRLLVAIALLVGLGVCLHQIASLAPSTQPQTSLVGPPPQQPSAPLPALPAPPSTAAGSSGGQDVAPDELRQFALDLVNQRRHELGLPALKGGDSAAAQLLAEQSLSELGDVPYTADGLPAGALYTTMGGRGYAWQTGGKVSGYSDRVSLERCRSMPEICQEVVPEAKVRAYIERRLAEDATSDADGLLSPGWEALHLGIAYSDLTVSMVELLERQGIDYIREPTIEGGFLSLEVAHRAGQAIEYFELFHYALAGADPEWARESVLTVFKPPEPRYSRTLPDGSSTVADYWAENGTSVEMAVSLVGRLPGPGVYALVTWDGSGLPASRYYFQVPNAGDLELDLALRPFDVPEPPSLESLRAYALDLINADRVKHDVAPVALGSNRAAQVHAEDALASGYLVGHWTSDGRKPYMLYRQAGGVGYMGENASAGGRYSLARCTQPRVVCGPIDHKAVIARKQWNMMYDDAHAHWGHRDAILDPAYDTVNLGIAFNDYQLTFYQHFEVTGLSYRRAPVLKDGVLRLRVRPGDGYGIGGLSVFYDPPPTPKTNVEIDGKDSYCVGGGFTDDCDKVAAIARVLKPPREGSFYPSLPARSVVASRWIEHGDGSVEIAADLGAFTTQAGVYTKLVASSGGVPSWLGMYSIFR